MRFFAVLLGAALFSSEAGAQSHIAPEETAARAAEQGMRGNPYNPYRLEEPGPRIVRVGEGDRAVEFLRLCEPPVSLEGDTKRKVQICIWQK